VVFVSCLLGRQPGITGQQPASHGVIGWAVHRFDADQATAVETEYRELTAVCITARDRLSMTRRNAAYLKRQIALIAPEPGHLIIGLPPSSEPGGDAASLVDGILHRLETNAAGCERGRKACAVADRKDRRVAGSQVFVDNDAIIGGEPSLM